MWQEVLIAELFIAAVVTERIRSLAAEGASTWKLGVPGARIHLSEHLSKLCRQILPFVTIHSIRLHVLEARTISIEDVF